jgi:hypothetical protein
VLGPELLTRLSCPRSQFVRTPQNSWGVELPNRTWNGVVGSMMRGEADVSTIGLVATPARTAVIDFLPPIMELK